MTRNLESGDTDLANIRLGNPMMVVENCVTARSPNDSAILLIEATINRRQTVYNLTLKDISGHEAKYSGRDIDEGMRRVIAEFAGQIGEGEPVA